MTEAPHRSKTSSWITVGLVVLAAIILGFALPMESLALGIVGGILLLAGIVLGFAGKIMEDAH
ncbi:MAG: hypothetical protein JWL64_1980 [Frankiales bacterium]|nr:hypothetical protein [Frankiales bacterium]